MKYARTMDDDFPIAYEREKPDFNAPIMFWDGSTAHLQDDDILCLGHPRCLSFNMRRQHIIKESENIEELFDLIVLRQDGEIRNVYKTYDDAVIAEGNNIVAYEIIGAIVTKKGLVFVAKENEETEELFKLI